MEMKAVKSMAVLLLVSIISLVLLTSCRPGSGQSDSADRVIGSSSSVLRIISGSENAELEPILEKFAEQEGIEIQMSYQGSLDIMRLLRYPVQFRRQRLYRFSLCPSGQSGGDHLGRSAERGAENTDEGTAFWCGSFFRKFRLAQGYVSGRKL